MVGKHSSWDLSVYNAKFELYHFQRGSKAQNAGIRAGRFEELPAAVSVLLRSSALVGGELSRPRPGNACHRWPWRCHSTGKSHWLRPQHRRHNTKGGVGNKGTLGNCAAIRCLVYWPVCCSSSLAWCHTQYRIHPGRHQSSSASRSRDRAAEPKKPKKGPSVLRPASMPVRPPLPESHSMYGPT